MLAGVSACQATVESSLGTKVAVFYSYDDGSLHNERLSLGPGIRQEEVTVQVQDFDISHEKQVTLRRCQLAVWNSETVHQKKSVFLLCSISVPGESEKSPKAGGGRLHVRFTRARNLRAPDC